jgi:hypothetical protein
MERQKKMPKMSKWSNKNSSFFDTVPAFNFLPERRLQRSIDMELLRYSRQMILPQVGGDGQQTFLSSKVLVVGAGGIGSTVAMYLAASGIPTDVLDFDKVEVSNLHR